VDAVRNVHALGVPLEAALRAAGEVPARVLDDNTVGRLAIGLPADIVVLDDRLEVERVLIGGETRVAC
jgi:N-acetylglucosamine-6-phosphate deacetylase